jgi:short-subunit dehydrogenase
MADRPFTGKHVVISGASSGIGAATARLLAGQGARVSLLARNESRLAGLAAEVRACGGDAYYCAVDLADAAATEQAAAAVLANAGPVDGLINNAGAGCWLALEETSSEELLSMTAVPYFAAFILTRAFLPPMLERDAGHIINVTSPAAYTPFAGSTAYSVARYAMRGFNKALAADLFDTHIHTTLVTAGHVDTPYFANNPGSLERLPRLEKLMPTLTPQQLAQAISGALQRPRAEVVIPFLLRVFLGVHRLFPGLVENVVYRTGWRRPKGEPL